MVYSRTSHKAMLRRATAVPDHGFSAPPARPAAAKHHHGRSFRRAPRVKLVVLFMVVTVVALAVLLLHAAPRLAASRAAAAAADAAATIASTSSFPDSVMSGVRPSSSPLHSSRRFFQLPAGYLSPPAPTDPRLGHYDKSESCPSWAWQDAATKVWHPWLPTMVRVDFVPVTDE